MHQVSLRRKVAGRTAGGVTDNETAEKSEGRGSSLYDRKMTRL